MPIATPFTHEEIVAEIRSRKSLAPQCIATADWYLSGFSSFGSKGLLSTLWEKELAESSSRLTYCYGEMADPEFLTKSIRDDAAITKGAILEYDAILSSRRKDRDGDVLEQKGGLELDAKMPLLWQHIQLQPIGKHVAMLEQTEDYTKCRFAIADTELGRDAATLVRMGALRKSHGFRPVDAVPLSITKNALGQDTVSGWHIKKANCMEGSLVSIPANAATGVLAYYEKEFDGLATAYSRNLLLTDAVKHYAKELYNKRPVQVPGADLTTTPPETKSMPANTMKCESCKTSFNLTAVPDGMDLSKANCPMCGKLISGGGVDAKSGGDDLQTKAGKTLSAKNHKCLKDAQTSIQSVLDDADSGDEMGAEYKTLSPLVELQTKSTDLVLKGGPIEDRIPGSYEWIREKLESTAVKYLAAMGVDTSSVYYCDIYAMMPTFCIVTTGYSSGKCYKISWELASEMPRWTGEPKEVAVQPTVIEKHLAELSTKNAKANPPPASPAPKTIKQLTQELIARSLNAESEGMGDVGLKAMEDCALIAKSLRSQMHNNELESLFQ